MSTFLIKFWRGQIPLGATFWLGWAVPLLGLFVVLAVLGTWVVQKIGITPIFVLTFLAAVIAVVSTVAVWRSTTLYAGPGVLKLGARMTSLLGASWHLFNFGVLVYVLIILAQGAPSSHDEDRVAEKAAIPSASHPMAGFWKTQSSDNFGLAVSPAGANKYSVSFCGPGGCFKPGTYRPDTTLAGDQDYQIVDQNTVRIQGRDGWTTYHRAPSRGEQCVENK
ncbi:MAG: hypothetical protein AABY73_12725 [Pseudomonadota bacterium]